MSEQLDPKILFDLIAAHVPADLKPNLLVIGSLAAAYHHREALRGGAINTKDIDLVIQPAGAITECRDIAQRLLVQGWRRRSYGTHACVPRAEPEPLDQLAIIRLHPPATDAYFIEFLAFPEDGQAELKKLVPIQLDDGWYCVPSFRYLGLTTHDRQQAHNGIAYAAPSMMALANLLSHPTLGAARMTELIGGRSLLRSAKDLGRVLALARLSSRDAIEAWALAWSTALRTRFPGEYPALGANAGSGLRSLLDDTVTLDEARHAIDVGLLSGYELTVDQLRALGRQLFADAIDPLAQACRA